jgi:hypothetical protein
VLKEYKFLVKKLFTPGAGLRNTFKIKAMIRG